MLVLAAGGNAGGDAFRGNDVACTLINNGTIRAGGGGGGAGGSGGTGGTGGGGQFTTTSTSTSTISGGKGANTTVLTINTGRSKQHHVQHVPCQRR